ncbi:hypothetical protein [Rhodococcus sovatensis]|uniref:Condensation domain-containing protein n=1 Tax=Rhodococcus sovatensis TaxID=1805840 RepID=A0ABZ2PHI6_9NOCA
MNPVKYSASAIDMLRSEARIVCVLGPADFGGLARIKERLGRLASAGPAARLGLRVDSSSRKWDYRPDLVCDDVTEIAAATRYDVSDRLAELSRSASTEVPVRARLAGEYLLLDLSHGLSDAVLPIELFAFLADPAESPELPAWATARTVRCPLPRAVASWMIHNPMKVVDVLYGKFFRSPHAGGSTAQGATAGAPIDESRIPWTRSPAVVAATSSAGATKSLREWRDANLPDVSVTSILSAAVASAFRARGIATSNSAAFLFDCRRYLRGTDGVVLGNFAVGIDFDGVDLTDANDVHRNVTHAIDKGRPLAAGALSALMYLRTRASLPVIATDSAPTSTRANLTFSDVGRLRQLESIAWTDDPSRRSFYPLSEPSFPDTIVVTSMHLRDTFHVSASFHDNFFDRDIVQSAMDLAMKDPVALLSA